MTTRRYPDCDPPIAVEFDDPAVVLRVIDLTTKTVYTALSPDPSHPDAIYDPAYVQVTADDLAARDGAYAAAVREIVKDVPEADIYRFDKDGEVGIKVFDRNTGLPLAAGKASQVEAAIAKAQPEMEVKVK